MDKIEPKIEAVIEYVSLCRHLVFLPCTTRINPSFRAMIPKINSTALPNVAFNKAPTVDPDLRAISSVAILIS